MPHRDPQTGQFVADDGMAGIDDIEVATFNAELGVQASDLTGGTGFTGGDAEEFLGVEVVDYDEIVDRNEHLVLMEASHALNAYINSTSSADGTLKATAEVSAQPTLSTNSYAVTTDTVNSENETGVGRGQQEDTIDLIGRPLSAVAHAPFNDTATGIGGGGSAGHDNYDTRTFPGEFARFHPRDELFVNAEIEVWNTDDSGVHLEVVGQHVYGVMAD